MDVFLISSTLYRDNFATMKSSIITLAALFSTCQAFVPSGRDANTRGASLSAQSGDVTRAARGTYANHGTGEIGSYERAAPSAGAPLDAVVGDEIREARSTYAAHGTGEIGSFNRAPPKAGAPTGSVCGEETRSARTTYAAHGTGEVGSTARQGFVPNSATSTATYDDDERDDEGNWRT